MDLGPAETFTTEFEGTGLLFDQAMAQTRMAVCMTDPHLPDNPIVFVNKAFLNLTGYGMADVLGRNCRFLQGAGTDPEQVQFLRDAITEQKTVVVELLNYRKDGTPFWNALHLGPIYDEAGELLYYFGSQWDVTEVYDARQEMRQSRQLARELSHRLKNVFAVIGSIVNLSGRRDNARPVTDRIGDRVAALGRAYDASIEGSLRGEVDLDEVVDRILSAYDPRNADRYSTDGPRVFVPDRSLSVLGLCLHELATNAVKYGAWSEGDGHVSIEWREDGDDLVLHWTETGGPEVDPDTLTEGTGTSILRTLVAAVQGGMSREVVDDDAGGNGVRVRLRLPLDDADPAASEHQPEAPFRRELNA